MKLQEQRMVTTPQAEAFAYTADFSNIENWDPGVTRSRRIGDKPVGPGTRFDLEVKFGANTIPMVYEINVYVPDERVVLIGKGDTSMRSTRSGFGPKAIRRSSTTRPTSVSTTGSSTWSPCWLPC